MWRSADTPLPFDFALNNVTYNATTNDTCYDLDEKVFPGNLPKYTIFLFLTSSFVNSGIRKFSLPWR